MKIEYVHFYVNDAKAWRNWFVTHLGFQVLSEGIQEYLNFQVQTQTLAPQPHTCTEVVKSGSVCFLLSSPLLPTSPVVEFLRQHPPGVADVAFCVEDVRTVIRSAETYGAKLLQPIQQHQQGGEYVKWSKIRGWGSLTHTLIERSSPIKQKTNDNLITAIDHIVFNVAAGDLQPAVAWYENILDFQPQQVFNIQTERSALHSQVLISRNGCVQLPINQPTTPNSQIQEFLNFNRGAGIQHIALQTSNIITAIAQFRSCGLSFLPVSTAYYDQLLLRPTLPLQPEELKAIAQQEILVDWQENTSVPGKQIPLLLQIFTQPIFGQPTFFFEFIERRGQARGFGEGNFRALFEAIESEQIKRGTLSL
jgi:4-hydroxyphenylpyruvate dioxygenase